MLQLLSSMTIATATTIKGITIIITITNFIYDV